MPLDRLVGPSGALPSGNVKCTLHLLSIHADPLRSTMHCLGFSKCSLCDMQIYAAPQLVQLHDVERYDIDLHRRIQYTSGASLTPRTINTRSSLRCLEYW